MNIYLVGGAVRDQLLNLPCHEHDWVVVGATAQELIAQGFQQVGNHFPVFLHPKTHEEYALARREKKTGTGHQGFSCIFSADVTLEEDLMRRDLTINAIAMDKSGQLIDPYHGIDDLKHRILKHVSQAFIEDPLRVLRTARFHAKFYDLGFHIAPETLKLMQEVVTSKELYELSKERLWKEWCKAFATDHPEIYLKSLEQCGALEQLMPELHLSLIDKTPYINWQKQNPDYKMMLYWQILIKAPDLATKIQQFKNLSQNLCVPKQLIETTIRFFKLAESLKNTLHPSPNEILSLFENLDAFRQRSSVNQALNCARIAELLNPKDLKKWQYALAQCQHITLPSSIQASKDISLIRQSLKEQRLNVIQQIFVN